MNMDNVYEIRGQLTSQKVLDLLREYLYEIYPLDEVDEALKNISIEVNRSSNKRVVTSAVTKGEKDYTKYRFRGVEYNKSWLPYAVINAYVEENPDISYQMLKAVFPKSLQGSFQVVVTPEEGARYELPGKRYHVNKAIILKDAVVWCCSQWGAGMNIERFIEKATNLGYNITPLK